MWGTAEDSNRRDDGEQREDDETESVDDHRSEFPIGNHLRLFVVLLDFIRDEPEFLEDQLELSLSTETGLVER